MADLKSIAKIQIGGPKYPDKKHINLYQREFKKSKIALELLAFAVFLVFLHFFVVFGVQEPLQHAERAELTYQRMEKQLDSIRRANRVITDVQNEYAHYGNSWQNETEKQTPDRLVMLNTLKERIFPRCSSIDSVSITEDQMNISCVLPKGTVLSELIGQIEEDEAVFYVTASLEDVGGDEEDANSSVLALNKEAKAEITVSFRKPGESGEKE